MVRVVFGGGLIGLSLWALFLPPVFPYSTHAIVNAKLVTLKAGDPGRISDLPTGEGPLVEAGGKVARVTRDLLKIQRDMELSQFSRLKLQEQIQSLDRLIETREKSLREAKSSAASAREGAMKAAERNLTAAREKARIAKDALSEKKASEARVAPLYKEGIVTSAQWSETRQQTIEAERLVAAAELELADEEARLGVFRQGPGGQVAEEIEGVTERIDAIEVEMGKLRVQRLDLQAELGAVDNKIAAAKKYQQSDLAYELTTPIKGQIWRRHVVNGENLREGQAVVDVADTDTVFIEAFFRRDFMNSIAVGDRATIQLIPEARIIPGHVTDIQIQDSTTKSPNIINTTPMGAWMLRVVIKPDAEAFGRENIGKMAQVLISKPKGGMIDRSLVSLTLLLRGHK